MINKLLHTPEGVRDIYGEECAKKHALQQRLLGVLHQYGYRDIETPSFEFFDVFSSEVGTIASNEIYKFFDKEGNTLSLRPDITPSIARAAAKYFMEEHYPMRLCYMGNTYINQNSYQGRLNESTQLGAEFIGDNHVQADAELIALIIELLLKAGLKEFQVSVGQVDFFKSLLDVAGLNDPEARETLRTMISHKHAFGVEELLDDYKIQGEVRNAFLRMPQLFGSIEILKEAKALAQNSTGAASIKRLEEIYNILCYYDLEKYVSFDLGMLSKYKYYSGIIFKAYTFGTGDAIVKGGRYDQLLKHFGKEAPSIGFAVEVDSLMNAMNRQKIDIPCDKSRTLVLYKEKQQEFAIRLTTQFRRNGMSVELVCMDESKTLDGYKEYGRRNQMGGILYLGDKKTVDVINLQNGEMHKTDLDQLLK